VHPPTDTIGAVLFARQNVALVTVTLAFWSSEGSLALALRALIDEREYQQGSP